MQSEVCDILAFDWSTPAPPRWIEPDLIVIDDIAGPTTLRMLAAGGQATRRVARPDRFRVLSRIDRDSALPDRVQVDDLLRAFAEEQGIPFVRDTELCEGGCDLSINDEIMPYSVLATGASPAPEIGGSGSLHIRAAAFDFAHAVVTGSMWFRRAPVQAVRLVGQLADSATLHDVAILLRSRMEPDRLLLIDLSECGLSDDAPARITLTALLQDSRASGVVCVDGRLYDNGRVSMHAARPTVVNLDDIEPLVADDPAWPRPAGSIEDAPLDRAYVGSCTTGRVDDLRLAAFQLRGRHVSIPTIISPASVRDAEQLEVERLDPHDHTSPTLMTVFRESGCDIGLPGCSACVNAIANLMDDGSPAGQTESSGNSGSRSLTIVATASAGVAAREIARIYTASPATAARSAIAGRIACR